ncbi:RcnB family protein [Sphingomonas sp. Leaf25]|uniref:RcnB family protein n=1 Tax=Sphingomonas sp. Leaf25 TaxID=1735692 RepID=UPI0009E6ADB4|nr:RcnB family protein [Sphingomonas sp. Leaf25]
MKSRFLLALLGATTLIPATAMAQDAPDRPGPRGRERIERQGGGEAPGARAEFNTAVRVEAPEARVERPQSDAGPRWQGRPDRGDRGDGGNARPDRPDRGERGDGNRWQGRPDRGDRPDAGAGAGAGWQPRPDRPARPEGVDRREFPRDGQGQVDRDALRRQWQDGRRGEWQRDQQRGQQQRDQWQRDQQRDQWQRDQDQQRGDWQRNRDRRDGGWSRSDGDWRDNGRYQNDRNDRSQWNRGWRADRRYDWNRYRDSNRGLYRLPRYYAPQGYGYGYRRFGIGVTLNSFLFGSNYWINDPYYYRLPEAYGAYRWVRYYNDALLVDVRTGRVVDVEYDIFW